MNVKGGARAHVSGRGGLNLFPGSRHWREAGSHLPRLQSQTGLPGPVPASLPRLGAEPGCLASRLWPMIVELELVILF